MQLSYKFLPERIYAFHLVTHHGEHLGVKVDGRISDPTRCDNI